MAVHKNCRTIREEQSKKEDKESWTFKKQLNEHNFKKLLKGGAGLLEEFGKFLETYNEKQFEYGA